MQRAKGSRRSRVDGRKTFVGVEREDPRHVGQFKLSVPGRGEVAGPRHGEHASPKRPGDLYGVVTRAGVYDDQFVSDLRHTGEASGKCLSTVSHDHAEADGSRRQGAGLVDFGFGCENQIGRPLLCGPSLVRTPG